MKARHKTIREMLTEERIDKIYQTFQALKKGTPLSKEQLQYIGWRYRHYPDDIKLLANTYRTKSVINYNHLINLYHEEKS